MKKKLINLNQIIIGALLMTTILVSCRQEGSKDQTNTASQDSLGGVMPDVPLQVLDNAYTAILNKMCNHQEFSDLKYTTQNTDFYSLDNHDSTALFLSVSEVDCGFTPGSCGRNIEIIRKEKNQYESLFKTCGKISKINTDHPKYLLILSYMTTSEKETEVTYDGKNLMAHTVSYFGMPIEDLTAISEAEQLLLNNFIRKGKKTENLDAIMVDYNKYSLSDGNHVTTYSFKKDSTQVNHIFVKKDNKILSKLIVKGKVNWQQEANKLMVNNENTILQYAYQPQNKKFVVSTNI